MSRRTAAAPPAGAAAPFVRVPLPSYSSSSSSSAAAPANRIGDDRPLASSAAAAAASSRPVRPAAAASPPLPEYDLDALLGWDRTRAADRARDERALRDRILARDREIELDRRRVARLAGASSHLSDMLAAMMARSNLDADGFQVEQGPVIDEETGLPKRMQITLRCFSFAMLEAQKKSDGDKIILPSEALFQIQKLRLPFPLLFKLEKVGSDADERTKKKAASSSSSAASSTPSPALAQYAGVLEFSAPSDQVYLPQWMMENLRLQESDSVRIYSESNLAQGKWVKLQPHSQSFSALLRELGPKYFLENALRHYSVLSKGQRIMVTHAGEHYSLNVVDTKPADTVSLLGNLDLEVEFGPALDAPKEDRVDGGGQTFRAHASGAAPPPEEEEDDDLKRALAMSLAESGAAAAAAPSGSNAAVAERASAAASSPVAEDEGWAVSAPVVPAASSSAASSLQSRFGGGNRLGSVASMAEAKYGEPAASALPNPTPAAPAASPESKEEKEALEAEDDDDEDSADESEAPPLAAVDVPAGHSLCPTCNRAITTASFSLHTLHCARAFIKCVVCARMIKKIEAEAHAATHARVECPQCHMQLESKKLRKHSKRECAYRPMPCRWCAEPTPLIQLPSHEARCGDVTAPCSICEQPIPRRNAQTHPTSEGCRIQCGKCNEIVTSRDIVAHTKDKCAGRMIECLFCHLSFAARDQASHASYCGARTESCDKCSRYIKLRDMQQHIDSACTFPAVEVKPPPPAAAARASPALGAQNENAAARINLLASMLDGGSRVDPAIMAALLSQSVDLGDPLAAAAARQSVAAPSAAAASSASRQVSAARSQQRAQALRQAQEISSDDDDEEMAVRAPPKKPVAYSASSVARPAPAAAPRASSVQRAPSPTAVRPPPPAGSVTCAYCSDRCASLESLQVHILTECSEAHARMEIADPEAAAKALAGLSIKEHVNVRVPVAKPVLKSYGSSSSSSGASASPPPRAAAAPSSSSSSSAAAAAAASLPFDPYDMSWKKPHRQASEELRRHTAARKSSGFGHDDNDDDEVQEVSAAEVRAAKAVAAAKAAVAAASVPARPKLITSNAKLRANAPAPQSGGASSNSSSIRSSARDLDDDDAPRISSFAPAASSSGRANRTSFTTTPLSIKQQQHELAQSISARKGAAVAATAAASKPPTRSSRDEDDEEDRAPRSSSGSSARHPSPGAAPKRSSGSSAASSNSSNSGSGFSSRPSGMSPSFMAGLGADVPVRATASAAAPPPSFGPSSRAHDEHDYSAARPKPAAFLSATSAAARVAPVSSSSSSSALRSSSPHSSARSRPAASPEVSSPLSSLLASGGSGSKPLSSYSGAGLGASSSYQPSTYQPSSYQPSSALYSTPASSSSSSSSSSSLSSRDRPSFDRPLAGSRAQPSINVASALQSSSHGLSHPPSPPSHQKASSSKVPTSSSYGASSAAYSSAYPSSAAFALPARSSYTSAPSSSAAQPARARAPSATRTPARSSAASSSAAATPPSPHVPLYSGGRKKSSATTNARQ